MGYLKPLSLFEYAKKLNQALLGVDIGKMTTGVCVAYPSTGSIFAARSPDGKIYIHRNTGDTAVDLHSLSADLDMLAGQYTAAGIHYGFPYYKPLVRNPNLGFVALQGILGLNYLQTRPYTVVNEELSSHFAKNRVLMDYFKELKGFTEWTQEVDTAFIAYQNLPNISATINYLESQRLDSYSAVQFSEWYFNFACGTGSPILIKGSPELWDGNFLVTQKFIQNRMQGLGFFPDYD